MWRRIGLLMYNTNAPINVKPSFGGGGGGGVADPGEFDIFMEARVKFPTPRHLLNVKFPPLARFSRSSKMAGMSNS